MGRRPTTSRAASAGATLLVASLMACTPHRIPEPPPAARVQVAFVGDSITAGGDWQRAFPHLAIANHGVSGDTTLDVLARLPRIRASGAHTYLLMVGINDILAGARPETVAPRILKISRDLGGVRGDRVLLQSVLPCQRPICGEAVLQRVEELNQLLKKGTPSTDFIDLRAGMRDASGGLRDAYTSDGLHLNAMGYRRWQALLAPYLEALSRGGVEPAPDPERP